MAGHVQDRWYKTEPGPDGKPIRVKTNRYGTGMRYRARYIGPDGTEKSKSFPDRQKRKADEWLANVEADMSRGQYIDYSAGRMTLESFGEQWLSSWTGDPATLHVTARRLRLHVFPHLGSRPLSSITPSHLREWLATIQDKGLAASTRQVVYANFSTLLTAAVDDGRIAKNPFGVASVSAPKRDPRRVEPWPDEWVFGVRTSLPNEFGSVIDIAGGCGLRQGEIFGLAVDQVDAANGVLHVVRQVKMIGNRPVFAPPKFQKLRDVPLPETVAASIAKHVDLFPPVEVTLPWKTLDGEPVTAPLLFYRSNKRELDRNAFNRYIWKPALRSAEVPATRANGMHALRHFYASVLLDAGESVRALSEYLGHADPAFTLRVYTHLMRASEKRTRDAVDAVFRRFPKFHGPQTAHEGA